MRFSRLLVFICLASAAIALTSGSAQAGDLVVYDLAGVSAGETLTQNPTFVAPGLSASSLSPGAGLTAEGLSFAYAFTGWTTSNSPDADDYIAFTVTPDAGNSVTYETISFRLVSASNLPPGPRMWELRGSGDGFATSLFLASIPTTGGSFTAGPLSLAALGTTASAVEFRLSGYEAGESFAVGGLANDPEFPNPPGVVVTGRNGSARGRGRARAVLGRLALRGSPDSLGRPSASPLGLRLPSSSSRSRRAGAFPTHSIPEHAMIRNRLLALAYLFALSGFAIPVQAGLFTFTGSFTAVGLNPNIVPTGTQSGSFSFQVDYTGLDGTYFNLPGTLQLTLSQSTIGGEEFSVAAGNVLGAVVFQDDIPSRLWVAGTPNGIAVVGSGGVSDFFIRYFIATPGVPGPLFANLFASTDGSVVSNAATSNLTGVTTYVATAVPEPSTLAMVGIAAIALVGRRLRRGA